MLDSTLGPSSTTVPISNGALTSLPSSAHITDEVIPPVHTHRTLVLCFDGTGDQFDADNSNVVQFFSMLKKDEPRQQMAYYQAGIGTYTIPPKPTPFRAKLSKIIDMMIGHHLDAHVMGGYEFLMQNYEAGDKICIFGFSRGAYTARALAGMIYEVGLLPRSNHQQVPFAYNMYSRNDKLGWQQSAEFKKAFSINVDIEFVGVWDTVSSVGIIPRILPFTTVNNHIRYFRHAMSLDEHRIRFRPNFFTWSTNKDLKRSVKRHEMPHSFRKVPFPPAPHAVKQYTDSIHKHEPSLDYQPITMTDVEEVWFAGAHCDVGGGSVANGTRNSLARIPLRWMVKQCFLANTGIMFYRSMFKQIGMDEAALHLDGPRPPPIYQTPCPPGYSVPKPRVVYPMDMARTFVSEEQEDLADALCPLHDQLKIKWGWWILEFIPQVLPYQRDKDKRWERGFVLNRGEGRHIPMQHNKGVKVKFHRTVQIRAKADGLAGGKYKWRAKGEVEPEWVD